jgi:hypothetical protein
LTPGSGRSGLGHRIAAIQIGVEQIERGHVEGRRNGDLGAVRDQSLGEVEARLTVVETPVDVGSRDVE